MKLAVMEMKSGNPVLVRRGRARMLGLNTVMIGSGVVPGVLSALLGGVGEEEDEALRDSMPEYLRNHSFIYFNTKGGLNSIDLTYVNPFAQHGDPWARAFSEFFRPGGGPVSAATRLIGAGISDVFLDDQILFGAVTSAKRNLDPTTGQPIWLEGVDEPHEAAAKWLAFVVDNAFAPRLVADSYKAFKAIGKDGAVTRETPAMIMWKGMAPFRIHQVDPEQQLRRFLFQQQDNYNTVAKRKYRAMSDKPMGPEEIRELYNYEVRMKNRINSNVYRKIRGFHSLGIPAPDIGSSMLELRYGKERTHMLYNGLMGRPKITEKFQQSLLQREYGADRLRSLTAAMMTTPRVMALEEIR